MKKAALIISLLLTGCAYTHEPKLAEPPKDQAKYEADKKACRSEGFQRIKAAGYSHTTPLNAFGAIGGAASVAVTNPHADDDKTVMDITDECLAAKGYKLAN